MQNWGTSTIKTESNKQSSEKYELLLARIKTGDKQAFEEVVKEFEKAVYKICYRFFNNEEDAMDATQEVFIKIYKYIDNFEGRSSLKTWIYKIASNTCITLSDKRKKEKEGLLKTISQWWSNTTYKAVEEEVIEKETQQINQNLLAQKIATLPETYRIPLILKDIEGMSLKMVSQILDIPEGTVKSRLNRGRRILQQSMAPSE